MRLKKSENRILQCYSNYALSCWNGFCMQRCYSYTHETLTHAFKRIPPDWMQKMHITASYFPPQARMGIRPNPWPLFMCCLWETASERRVKRSERENGCILLELMRSQWFRLRMLLDVYCHATLQKKSTVHAQFFLIGFTISVLSAYSCHVHEWLLWRIFKGIVHPEIKMCQKMLLAF